MLKPGMTSRLRPIYKPGYMTLATGLISKKGKGRGGPMVLANAYQRNAQTLKGLGLGVSLRKTPSLKLRQTKGLSNFISLSL